MSHKKANKKTLEAMMVLGFPVTKNFNDLNIEDIQKAYKAKVQSEPKVAAYDPLCPQTHPTGEEAKSEAVIFNAFKYLILKFMHEKAHLNHSEGCQNCAAHQKKSTVACKNEHIETPKLDLDTIKNTQADEDDRVAALDLANLLVAKQGLELSACHIIKRALDNPQRDEGPEIDKILTSVTTSSKSQGTIGLDKIVSTKILLSRTAWTHGPRRLSLKGPQRRMSMSAVREPGDVNATETLESTLEKLKLLNNGSESESQPNETNPGGRVSAALTQRRLSMPGNIKLVPSKISNSKKQDILTIEEENDQTVPSKGTSITTHKKSK